MMSLRATVNGSFVIGPISSRRRAHTKVGGLAGLALAHQLALVSDHDGDSLLLSHETHESFYLPPSLPGCRTCPPTRPASNGDRWTGRPAARAMAIASFARHPPNTSTSGDGYRITTFRGRQSHRRRPPCTLPSRSWPAMLK